jgi:AcrR family transcriptional regulator
MGEFEDRRAALAGAVADHLLVEGLGDSGLRALARAAGTSDRMLLYYFRDKAEVLEAALDLVAERALAALDAEGPGGRVSEAELLGRLAATLHDPRWGAPNRLWIEVSARATRGEEPWRSAAGRLLGRVSDWVAARLPEGEEARAARLIALVEGAALLEAAGRPDLARAALDQGAK